jgi:hypothetical protein
MKNLSSHHRFLQFALVTMMAFLASCAPETEQDIVADYTGTWTCTETTSNPATTSNYSVRLKKVGSSTSEYKIENFYNLGFNNEAAVSIGISSITIASQTIGSGNGAFTASGSGTVNSATKLTMSYKMDDGSGVTDNCSATFAKQ